jgi:hypothetical protein
MYLFSVKPEMNFTRFRMFLIRFFDACRPGRDYR